MSEESTGGVSRIVTVGEAAHILGTSERTVWRRIKAGKLPTVDMNGKTCVQLQSVNVEPSGEVVNPTDDSRQPMSDTSGTVSMLREIIGMQSSEIEFLRSELKDKQRTIDTLTPMLPAPATVKRPAARLWVGLLVIIALLALLDLFPLLRSWFINWK